MLNHFLKCSLKKFLFIDFFTDLHEGNVPMIQLEPNWNRTVFRMLEAADQLQGMADHAALALTIDKENEQGLLELGSQALESYPGSIAVVRSDISGTVKDKIAWVNDLNIPFGFAVHLLAGSQINGAKKLALISKINHFILTLLL